MTLLTVLSSANVPPPPSVDERLLALLDALTMDFVAIRNNSRSTAGDPWKRLQGNVARAQKGIDRIVSFGKGAT